MAVSMLAVLLSASCVSVATLYFLYPLWFSTSTAALLDVWAGISAWFTPPLLFLLMNLVVCALFFTSTGSVLQRPAGEEIKKNGGTTNREGIKRYNAVSRHRLQQKQVDEEDEDNVEEEEVAEADEGSMYPEVFTFFFGERSIALRRKLSGMDWHPSSSPSSSSSATQIKGLIGRSKSEVHSFSTVNPSASSSPSSVVHTNARSRTASAPELSVDGSRREQNVDRRADDFIGNFYMKMKSQQEVDPFKQRLERSA